MSKHMDFNALEAPIAGVNLIEASAGTGKTYSIAALFLRLVLIEHIAVDRILVVTFTKAATAELKNRLRARLDSAFQILRLAHDYQVAQQANADVLPDDLAEKLANHPFFADYGPEFADTAFLLAANEKEHLPRLCLRLQAALNQFDHASIYTIHSYCQRLLQDYAFLCQSPFQTELSEDTAEALQVLADDFWRHHVIHDAALSSCVFQKRLTPDILLHSVRRFINRPYIVHDQPVIPNLATAQSHLDTVWQEIKRRLPELYALFTKYPASNFHGSWMKHADYCEQVFDALLSHGLAAMDSNVQSKLANFGEELFKKRIAKKGPATFEDLAELTILATLAEAYQTVLAEQDLVIEQLHFDLLNYINQAWKQEKQQSSQRGFDDLLVDVYDALQDETYGQDLAQSIANKWQVALIDEFQDTDPLQYRIFQQSFIDNQIPIFLVGDPKQAIYRFRGADIHAYLQAADDASCRYTLATNFRSHSRLVNSIAHLFMQKDRPFIMNNIPFVDVKAHRLDSNLSDKLAAIQLCWLNQDSDEDKGINKDVARARASEVCALQIAQLLNDGQQHQLLLKTHPLQASDIAILVRSHNEGKEVRDALAKKNIASVMISQDSVFASIEAQTAIALLSWWLSPTKTDILRHVLLGPLFTFSAKALHQLNQSEDELSHWIESAQLAQKIWFENSIFAAYQFFSDRHQLEAGLLATQAQRTLTNIHQVFELLAAESLEHDHPESLLQWLEKQVFAAKNQLSHQKSQLRLESDDDLIKIVTMHASKGLQYPIVFCPFMWDQREFKPEGFNLTHDEDKTAILKSKNQLSSDESATLTLDQLSEDLRLLYVALTRAEERLYLNLAHGSFSPKSALTYLLGGQADDGPMDVANQCKSLLATDTHAMWDTWIKQQNQKHSIAWVNAPNDSALFTPQATQETASCRTWQPRRFTWVQNSSFTALSRQTKAIASSNLDASDEIKPSLDAGEIAQQHTPIIQDNDNALDEWDIFHFPKGAHAGLCLHELLERLAFQIDANAQTDRLLPILAQYGFADDWWPAVANMLNATRLARLKSFNLAELNDNARLPEMGFVLKTEDLSWQNIKAFLETANLPDNIKQAIYGLDFHTVQGFLNGFIDMTCYIEDGHVAIIDYKSNHLGMTQGDYHQTALDEAMAHHHYYLQALLYAVAIKRYFALRNTPLVNIHVHYLFLRGINNHNENGIWSWDIAVSDLDNLII